MIRFFRSGGHDAKDSLKNMTSLEWKECISNQRWVLLILFVMVDCIFLLRKCGFSPPSSQAVLLYKKMQKRLNKERHQNKTPSDRVGSIELQHPRLKFHKAKQTIDYYEKVRFGNQ
jgi:hypothetical protein